MEINCKFLYASWWKGEKPQQYFYTCEVEGAELYVQSREVVAFKAARSQGILHTNHNVQGIEFKRCKMEFMPRGLNHHFPNLDHLSIVDCGLKEISKRDLCGLENLIHLSIENCELRSLPDDLFEGMTKLQCVLFNKNEIEFASSKLLKPLVGRANVKIYLLKNKTIDAFYDSGSPGSVKSLEVLMEMIDNQCKQSVDQALPVVPIETVSKDLHDFNPKITELWRSGKYSDLRIVVDKVEFKVHKNILAMQSPNFARIIDENEATEINIKEFSASAVANLLHLMYTGEVRNDENAEENLEIAAKLGSSETKAVFEGILINQLNDANAFDLFMLAHNNSADNLKQKSFSLMAKMFPDELPKELMEQPEKLERLFDMKCEYDSIMGK